MQVNPFVALTPKVAQETGKRGPATAGNLFQQVLQEANRLQLEADWETSRFLSGQTEDLHRVIIASEQARLSLQLTVQVANKMVEAYREIARMQI